MQEAILGPGIDGLNNADVPHGKSRLAVLQVVVPFAYESIVEAEGANFRESGVKGLPPKMQGVGVGGAEVLKVMQKKIPGLVEGLVDTAYAEQERAWKNVFLNPIDAFAELHIFVVGHGDVL